MSNKRFDFSVLPNGFLLEFLEYGDEVWAIEKMCKLNRRHDATEFRPALNHRHFNDGSMVLPDGLVFIAKDLTGYEFTEVTPYPFEYDLEDPLHSIVGVRIIGAHPDYAEHAKELGIEVVEI